MKTATRKVIVNDIDGNAFHTIFVGTVDECYTQFANHPVASMLQKALRTGEIVQKTYMVGEEEYTSKVIVQD